MPNNIGNRPYNVNIIVNIIFRFRSYIDGRGTTVILMTVHIMSILFCFGPNYMDGRRHNTDVRQHNVEIMTILFLVVPHYNDGRSIDGRMFVRSPTLY